MNVEFLSRAPPQDVGLFGGLSKPPLQPGIVGDAGLEVLTHALIKLRGNMAGNAIVVLPRLNILPGSE